MNSEKTITFCTSIGAIALLSVSGFILNEQVLAARGSGNIGNVGHLYMGVSPATRTLVVTQTTAATPT
jgi:hypothetical protein